MVKAGPAAKNHTQARGRERRKALLHAARALLDKHDFDQITLPMIAEQANIPPSSTYHFYPVVADLYTDLARSISTEMVGHIATDRSFARSATWHAVVRGFMEAAASFFNADRAALQLMLGPRTPPDIKRAACYEDHRFGNALRALLERDFVLPHLNDPEGTFFRAIQIADLMFSLSVAEHDMVTEWGCEEGVNASIAYLGLYLPPMVPAKPAELYEFARDG